MIRSVLLVATTIVCSAIAYAGESTAETSTAEKTTIKVYPVGDLVSVDAMNGNMGGKTTSDEWASEYPETVRALDELQSIVETMCQRKPAAVRAYAPSLSLIVRHTEEGHNEIDQLLRTLGEGNGASIRLECRVLDSEGSSGLLSEELGDAERQRLELLLTKTHPLTNSDTNELLALLPSRPEYKHTVMLKSGRRTPWGPAGRPCTAMGRVDRDKKMVEVRMDYISDDYAEATPFGSQVFSLGEGESALFHHYCDGGMAVWLVTAEILTQESTLTRGSQSDR